VLHRMGRLAPAVLMLATGTTIAAAEYPERRLQHIYTWEKEELQKLD
jgi:hypothetical protein